MRKWLCGCLLFFGCDSATSQPPLAPCSPSLPSSATATVDPSGAAACSESGAVTIAKAPDLVVAAYTPIGDAYTFTPSGMIMPHGLDFLLPFRTGALAGRATEVVVLAKWRHVAPQAAMVSNLFIDGDRGRARFHALPLAAEPIVFQLALPNAVRPKTRHYTFRAIGGASMGGIGSSMNFFLHPDRYDAIGVLGADPGPDLTYSLGMIRDFFLAGFCTADVDGPQKVGQLCPTTRKLLTDQGERASSFESFLYEPGDGTGLTLRRSLYIRANRDLARAFGNGGYYNPDSKYLPPGVDSSVLAMQNADICAHPVVLKKFFDRHYNPDGSQDVITFCDGNDSDAVGLGKFDPSVAETDPVQIALAVDLNKNGQRDSGEPVIVQGSEPFADVGTDKLADKDEPGYDPVTNPDPNGDDYHYLWNPTGTENNWRYDQGEPFEDVGIDGVAAATGGCAAESGKSGCYDYGEGNGKFDYNPGQLNWRAHDPRSLAEALTADQWNRLDTYYDAGIRDFFNAQVSSNSLMAAMHNAGASVRLFDGFPILNGKTLADESLVELTNLDYSTYGHHMYVRYGNPDLSEAEVESSGDGRHAGSALQVVHRAQAVLFFLASRWPGGDRAIAPVDSAKARVDDFLMTTEGRRTPFTVVLPPGYFQPENAGKTYPVVYFMHGYGMDPSSLAAVALIAQNAMVDDTVPQERRMQKFILVFVDGKCRPGGDIDSNGPLPADGDLCEEGTFYTDHPDGTAQGENILIELQAHIDATYRTKPPADL